MMPGRVLQIVVVCFVSTNARDFWTERYESDPELYVEWTTPLPRDEAVTWQFSSGATWVGNLYAGRTEFPWIVDIRYENTDQESWGIGNIITYYHVLTTCRVVSTFITMETDRIREQQRPDRQQLRIKIEYRPGVKISYCSTYLWTDYEITDELGVVAKDLYEDPIIEAGTRLIADMNVHPECQWDSILNDLAVIRLKTPIYPWPPVLSYMPIPFKWSTYEIPISDLSSMTRRRMVCYVASYGRGYRNIRFHRAVDYKVKYRVYWDTWRLCFEAWDKFEHDVLQKSLHNYLTEQDKLMCLISRAKVGTVCNHDHGAPVVCDGDVYGIVILGANLSYCSDLIAMPFFALKVNTFQPYYLDFLKGLYPKSTRVFGRSSASTLRTNQLLYHFSIFLVFPLLLIAVNGFYCILISLWLNFK